MSAATVVEYAADTDKVFKAVLGAVTELGYTVQNVDRSAGLLTFLAARHHVMGSAFMEEITPGNIRLSVSGSAGSEDLTPLAAMTRSTAGRAAVAFSAAARIDAPKRMAKELVAAVEQRLGGGTATVISVPPNQNPAARVVVIVLGVFLALVLLLILASSK